jgi:hypothetical protein
MSKSHGSGLAWPCAVVLALAGPGLRPQAAQAMPCTAMTLVLAIDGSGSIGDAEFGLQLAATAGALTDPAVVEAMAGLGGVAVAAVIWGDSAFGIQGLDWALIRDQASARVFAAALAGQPRRVSGNTDIGHGISAALDLIDNPANCASYNVIDVSGDGRESTLSDRSSIRLRVARARAEEMGVIINGLPIATVDAGLPAYYRDHVISGAGSFVIAAAGYRDFGDAIRRKILREVEGFALTLSAEAETGDIPPQARPERS